MRFHTVQPISMKLSRNGLYIQEKVDVYFVHKKNESYACYRQSMKLTNRIAEFQNVKGSGRESGRRSSERSSRHDFTRSICLKQRCACYRLPTELTNRITAFQRMQIAGSEGGRRPSERSFILRSRRKSTRGSTPPSWVGKGWVNFTHTIKHVSSQPSLCR